MLGQANPVKQKLTLLEKIQLARLEHAIVIELVTILNNKNSINEAVKTRSSVKLAHINGKKSVANLSDIDAAFTAEGELKLERIDVNIESTRVNEYTLQKFGVPKTLSRSLSTRELVLFDAVIFQAAHNVLERELLSKEEIDRNLNAKIELACVHVLEKIKHLHLASPNSYEIVTELAQELRQRELYYRSKMTLKKNLHGLAMQLFLMVDTLKELTGKNNPKHWLALKVMIEQTVERTDITLKNKFQMILDELIEISNEKLHQSLNPTCSSFLFHSTPIESVMTTLNANPNEMHMLRLCCLVLQAICSEHPQTQIQNPLLKRCLDDLVCPQHAIYKKFMLALYENNQRFQHFKTALKASGITVRDIFAFYLNEIHLDKHTMKALWPELKICRIDDSVLDALLDGIKDVVQLENLMTRVNMEAIYAAKAELMNPATKQELFVSIPLRKLENRRAIRDHLKEINLAIAMIKTRQAELVPGKQKDRIHP